MRIITDIFAYCREHVPQWNTISISGYHIREAGSTAVQEIAFTLANGIAYVEAAIDAGLDVDEFAPRLRSSGTRHNNFFEEVAKFRAARRMWYRIMTERFGAKDEKSKLLRFHTQTGGSTLTAQQPENNVVRVARPGAGGGARRHAEPAHQRLRRGARPADRAGGQGRAAHPADHRLRERRRRHPRSAGRLVLRRVADRRGRAAGVGVHRRRSTRWAARSPAIEAGFQQDEIEQAAYEYAKSIDDGERVIVGVNKFTSTTDARARRVPDRSRARSAARPSALARAARPTPRPRRGRGRARRRRRPPRAGTQNLLVPDEGGAAPPAPPSARSATPCATCSACTNPSR